MLPAVVFFFLNAVSALRICGRTHYTIASDVIFQRVELPSAEKCVERCVENINYCRAVVFLESKKKNLGFCIVHTVNSETDKEVVHPDASLDPKSTIYELVERCSPHSNSDMQKRISAAHRKLLEEGRQEFDDSSRSDAFFPEQERIAADEIRFDKKDHYAVMKSIDGGGSEDPRNPFDSPAPAPRKLTTGRTPYKTSSYETAGAGALIPIRPVQVFHLGQPAGQLQAPGGQPVNICRPGSPCYSHDTAPCPARQGDPCAPKPPCMANACFHVDAPPVTAPAEWSEWGPCSATCGPAARTRTCVGGSTCIGPISMLCALPPCMEWTPWTPWTLCSSTCGAGERQRTRMCRGGRECDGPSVMVESCQSAPCPTWAPWGEWQGCTISCGQGRERRNRICINGLFCNGPAFEDRICDRGPCPHWSNWTPWSQCTNSCGGGEMTRKRECVDGSTCAGASEERLMCNQQPCPTWGSWTSWTVCEDKCGEESFRLRNRVCLYRGNAYSGCEGPAQDQLPCPVRECASWTEWGDWGECSATCGQGNQLRTRKCEGGFDCAGPPSELRFCQLAACPYWGEWGAWSGCSVSCGLGVCERKRKCVTDEILNIPTDLSEFDESPAEFESEKAKAALIARSKHIKMMRNDTEVRRAPSRTMTDAGNCDGSDVDTKTCDAGPCCMWESWSDWSPCIGCGMTAMVRRNRQCVADGIHGAGMPPYGFQEEAPILQQTYVSPSRIGNQFGVAPIVPSIVHRGKRHSGFASFQADAMQCHCPGPAMESKPCPQAPSCDAPRPPCEWSSWGDWCGCTPCRAGREVRRRFCDRAGRPDPDCKCMGADEEERTCSLSETCFSGRQPPAIAASGDADQYVPIDSKINTVQLTRGHQSPNKKDSAFSTTPFPYPVCRWSKWSEWTECHEKRVKQRNRFCIGSDGLISNCQCMGQSTEEIDCDPAEMERLKPVNAVPGDSETTSLLEFNAEGGEDLDQGIDSALRSTDEEFSTDEGVNQKEEEKEEPPVGKETAKEECEWTRWSMWSDCTASCGQGERLRKRRCPCGAGKCGGGIETETEACQKTMCLERRSHPVFSMPSQ